MRALRTRTTDWAVPRFADLFLDLQAADLVFQALADRHKHVVHNGLYRAKQAMAQKQAEVNELLTDSPAVRMSRTGVTDS